MPQALRQEAPQEPDGPTPRQMLPADSTGMDAATPQPLARPTPSAFWNHYHLGRTGDPAPFTLRHVVRPGQGKEAEQDQDMQTTLGPLNRSAFCVTMHRSQPRVMRDGVHCTPFRGLAQIHYGQRQAPFSAPLRSPEAHFSDLDVPNLRRSRASGGWKSEDGHPLSPRWGNRGRSWLTSWRNCGNIYVVPRFAVTRGDSCPLQDRPSGSNNTGEQN